MPFDSAPQKTTLTRLEKLQRLLWLAERATGSQIDFCSCLHHDAMCDPILIASGLPAMPLDLATNPRPCPQEWDALAQWFGGASPGQMADRIFGPFSLMSKRSYLRDLIAREEKNRE